MTYLEIILSIAVILLIIFMIADTLAQKKATKKLHDHITDQNNHIKKMEKNYSDLIGSYKKLLEKMK